MGMRLLTAGEAMLKQGQLREAERYAEAARAAGLPVRARLLLGRVYMASGRLPEAEAAFDVVLKADPRNPAARAGKAALQRGRRAGQPGPR
jgi:tetratricopeptide (TPR) repeat protein